MSGRMRCVCLFLVAGAIADVARQLCAPAGPRVLTPVSSLRPKSPLARAVYALAPARAHGRRCIRAFPFPAPSLACGPVR
jgi:hypothetical protein